MKVFTKCDYCKENIELDANKMKALNFCCYGCNIKYKEEHKPVKKKQEYCKKPKIDKLVVKRYKDYLKDALKHKEVDSVYKMFKNKSNDSV